MVILGEDIGMAWILSSFNYCPYSVLIPIDKK